MKNIVIMAVPFLLSAIMYGITGSYITLVALLFTAMLLGRTIPWDGDYRKKLPLISRDYEILEKEFPVGSVVDYWEYFEEEKEMKLIRGRVIYHAILPYYHVCRVQAVIRELDYEGHEVSLRSLFDLRRAAGDRRRENLKS